MGRICFISIHHQTAGAEEADDPDDPGCGPAGRRRTPGSWASNSSAWLADIREIWIDQVRYLGPAEASGGFEIFLKRTTEVNASPPVRSWSSNTSPGLTVDGTFDRGRLVPGTRLAVDPAQVSLRLLDREKPGRPT